MDFAKSDIEIAVNFPAKLRRLLGDAIAHYPAFLNGRTISELSWIKNISLAGCATFT